MNTYIYVLPYADSTFADAYANDAKSDEDVSAWLVLAATTKTRLLKLSTLLIDLLPLDGSKNGSDEEQPREFPRNGMSAIPYDVSMCCAEIAFALANGKSLEGELQRAGYFSETIGDTSTTFDTTSYGALKIFELNQGMISAMAIRFLSPYLRDFDEIHLDRVS